MKKAYYAGHQNYQEKNAETWEERFAISFSLTWILPLIVLLSQFVFVGNQINYDVTKLSNWVGIEAVFVLPIRVFLLMVTITTLLGLYARSLQFTEQLRLSRLQQNLAFEQLKLAQKQSERLENQLSLYIKKESFSLYHEHIQRFKDKLDGLLSVTKEMFRFSNLLEGESIVIYSEKLYAHTFPDNNHTEIKNANLMSNNVIFDEDNPIIKIATMSEVNTSLDDEQLEAKLRILVVNLTSIGINIKTHTNAGEHFDARIFSIDLNRALVIIRELGLISDEHFFDVYPRCIAYFKPFFDVSKNR